MEYKVVITSDAEEDLDRFIRYLLFVKQNPQAATNCLSVPCSFTVSFTFFNEK